MSWYAAPSVAALLSQATTLYPDRDKRSDGTIGDAAHQAEQSDHNPDSKGCVHAADVTHGPYWGNPHLDGRLLCNAIIARRDPRLKYMIFERQIMSGNAGPFPWVWRSYYGASQHLEHVHVSINYTSASENDTSPWYSGTPTTDSGAPVMITVQSGDKSDHVAVVQGLLHTAAVMHNLCPDVKIDGDFGPSTLLAVQAYQHTFGLPTDGIVGEHTYARLLAL